MDRRSFLRSLGIVGAAVALEPVLPIRSVIYSFPTVIPARSSVPLTLSYSTDGGSSWLTVEALRILHKNLVWSDSFSEAYHSEFVQPVGSKLYVRCPQIFSVTS